MPRSIASVCALLLLAGAAPADAHAVPDFKATAHMVAIVSVLGDEIDSGEGPIAVADGGFDALAEDAMAHQIAADLPGATTIRIDAPRADLHTQMYPRAGFGDLGMKNVRAALRPWAAAHPADYIVIFRKTPGTLEGHYGTWTDKIGWFGISMTAGHPVAFLNVTVCDGRTLEVVSEMSARDVDWGSRPYHPFGKNPDDLAALTADVQAMLGSMAPALVHGAGL